MLLRPLLLVRKETHMSDRINIPKLRTWVEHGLETQTIVPARNQATLTWDEALALLDVAEAARHLQSGMNSQFDSEPHVRATEVHAVRDALARFDFGDGT